MEQEAKRGGRPRKDPAKKKRNRTFSMTDDEYARLGELAAAASMELSEYLIKSLGLNKPASQPTA